MRKSSYTAGYQWPGPNIDQRPALEQLEVPCRHPQRGKDRTGLSTAHEPTITTKRSRVAPRLTGKAPSLRTPDGGTLDQVAGTCLRR